MVLTDEQWNQINGTFPYDVNGRELANRAYALGFAAALERASETAYQECDRDILDICKAIRALKP